MYENQNHNRVFNSSFASRAGREIAGLSELMLSCTLREMLFSTSRRSKTFRDRSVVVSSSSADNTARIQCEESAEAGVPDTR